MSRHRAPRGRNEPGGPPTLPAAERPSGASTGGAPGRGPAIGLAERRVGDPGLDATAPIPVVATLRTREIPAPAATPDPSAATDPTPDPTSDPAPARQRAAARVVRRPLRLALFAFVLAGLIGGPAAFAGLTKQIQITVDGAPRTVETYASTVRGVLSAADISLGGFDSVTPAMDARVHDGDEIVVNRARPLQLTVDGHEVEVTVTATSVAEALQQLGYADPRTWVSASRSDRLPLAGGELAIRTPQPVTVVADGTTTTIHSAQETVGEALDDAGFPLAPSDQLSVSPDTPVTAGLSITVTRVGTETITEDRPLPFQVVKQPDPETYVGIEEVVTQGVNGVERVTVEVTLTDGVETARTDVSSEVAQAPVDEVVAVGAKEFPAEVNALNWAALAECESTNNLLAVSPSGAYYGLYQFGLATWQSVGGTGLPTEATPEEQLARAKLLYLRSGAGQWACGGHLTS